MPTFIVVHRRLFYICSAEKDAFNLLCATAFMKTGQTRLLAVFVLVLRVIFTLLREVE